MRKLKYIGLTLLSFWLLASFGNTYANYQGNTKDNNKNKIINKTAADPSLSVIDVNNITSWIQEDGLQPAILGGQSFNGQFPKGSNLGAIYQEGILWGGLVSDGQTPTVRIGGASYSTGNRAISRLFRVRPDYATADLSDDAANFFQEPNSAVTSGQIDQLKTQYAKDWEEWPGNDGAPYQDVNGDGVYEPKIDIPGVPGATQTVYIAYDDRDASTLYASPPMGMQVQETFWAYAIANPLGNCIFKRVRLIYTGTTKSSANSVIDSMYIAQFADPDVGQATDDYAGSDTALNLGYAYNSTAYDAKYSAQGLTPPAVGYDFLQGASYKTGNTSDSAIINFKWRKGYKYFQSKPMSGFIYFAAGGNWSDPTLVSNSGNYDNGTLQMYNLLRGYLPSPNYPSASPFPRPDQFGGPVGGFGTFLLDGDPVTGTGWIDGQVEPAGDRRILCINGPIKMNLGDTAEVVLALVGGMGSNNLTSISVMKYNDIFAQYAYDNQFNLPTFPSPSLVISPLDQKVSLNWGGNLAKVKAIEGADLGGYKFEGYNVYQMNPLAPNDLSRAVKITTFDKIDSLTAILDNEFDVTSGLIIQRPVQVGKNTGIERSLTITKDYITNKPLINGQNYYFAVTAYGYNPSSTVPYHALESAVTAVPVVPQMPNPGVSTPDIGDLSTSNIQHSAGSANASVDVKIVTPSQLTGDKYQLSFHTETYTLGSDATWTDITAASKKMRKVKDLTGSSLSSTVAWSEKKGSMDLHFLVDVVAPNYDYCDGVQIKLPAGVVVDTAYEPVSNNTGSPIPYTFDRATNTFFYSTINKDSLISGDTTNRSTNGVFAGGEDIIITVHPLTLPFVANYTMYDDNWGDNNGYYGGLVDVSGVDTVKGPIVNKVVTQRQWDVTNMTTGKIALANQTIMNGQDPYASDAYFPTHFFNGPGGSSGNSNPDVGVGANAIFDGIQVQLTGSYAAPTTFNSIELNGTPLSESSDLWTDAAGNYAITNFIYFGYADGTAAASISAYGGAGGTSSVNELQQDYEVRWTGVVGDTTVNGLTFTYTKSGGQLVTLFGASGYSLADHPLNPNPGTDAPFLIRVPFEIWNVDKNEQVNMEVWDRSSKLANGFKVWNTDARTYTWVVNTKYAPAVIDPASKTVADSATWNWVFYSSAFNKGDVLKISYANPLQVGQDAFTFTVPKQQYSTDLAKQDINKINVFPNPYYGYQDREVSREDHYVTFSHLPNKATIRIFDLAGVLVKTIQKNDNSQFTTWTLRNDSNYPVASGIYIAYIDMPDLGKTKILKLAIIQEVQVLPVY